MPLNKIDSAHFVYQAHCSNLKLSYTDPDEKYYYYWYFGQWYLWAILLAALSSGLTKRKVAAASYQKQIYWIFYVDPFKECRIIIQNSELKFWRQG